MSSIYSCASCGRSSARWFGRCPSCGAWSSLRSPQLPNERIEVVSLDSSLSGPDRFSTGVPEVDHVLGGGLVAGEVVLVAGEPGIGKSTLVLQLMGGMASLGRRPLLISAEESTGQVALRARRLGLRDHAETLLAASASRLDAVMEVWEREHPDVVVIDSIQTLEGGSLPNSAGSVAQVRECAAALLHQAKASGTVVIMIGHVTKEGAVAGPKTLEHLVDAVLTLEGERSGALRLLRASKNRFGSCEETAVFVMGGRGLEVVEDPSALLLADRRAGVTGSIVFAGLEGSRPVLVEIQALVSATKLIPPRRVAIGIDARRLALLLGVLSERAHLPTGSDVFVAAAGGLVVREPAADLALCLALFSAIGNFPLDDKMVAIGEVGLAGEIRRSPACERRLAEAQRLGFQKAFVAEGLSAAPSGIELVTVSDLSQAFARARPRRATAPVAAHQTTRATLDRGA